MAVGVPVLIALGLVGVLPFHAKFGDVEFIGHQVSWLLPVAGMSLVAAAFAYVAGISAARTLGARMSSFLGLTEVMFAVLWAWLLLSQLPTTLQFIGGALIAGGVTLVRLGDVRSPAATDEPADVPEVELVG